MSVCRFVHVRAGTHRVQKRVPNPLELSYKQFVRYRTWALVLNSGPLQDQDKLITTDTSLQTLDPFS